MRLSLYSRSILALVHMPFSGQARTVCALFTQAVQHPHHAQLREASPHILQHKWPDSLAGPYCQVPWNHCT